MEGSTLDPLATVTARARSTESNDRRRLEAVVGTMLTKADVTALTRQVRRHARLTLNFHPDRRDRNGLTVAEGLVLSNRYLSQFDTGISNGGRSAVPGGDRVRWERELFGTLYDTDFATRPVYGALDITRDPHGGSPRFGSSFVVLHEHCMDRATFCVGDSHVGPTDVGTIESLAAVLAGLFESCRDGQGLDRSLSVAGLRACLDGTAQTPPPARSLDGYIEAQIHGGVDLSHDVEAIVLDPSFHGTPIEAHLHRGCAERGIELRFHRGSELAAGRFPLDFRGPEMRSFAQGLARSDGLVDAAAIGRSARSISFTAPSPLGDLPDSALQRHKYLWHCLLRFGNDAPSA